MLANTTSESLHDASDVNNFGHKIEKLPRPLSSARRSSTADCSAYLKQRVDVPETEAEMRSTFSSARRSSTTACAGNRDVQNSIIIPKYQPPADAGILGAVARRASTTPQDGPLLFTGSSNQRPADVAPGAGAGARRGSLRSPEAVERRVSDWLLGATDLRRSQMEDLLSEGLPGQGSKFRGLRVVLKGVLLKRGRFNMAFKGRLFLLTEDGSLHYLASKSGHLAPGDKVHGYECIHKKSIHVGAKSTVYDGGFKNGTHHIYVEAPEPTGAHLTRRFEFATREKETCALWLSTLQRVQSIGLEQPAPSKDAEAESDSDGREDDAELAH